MMKLRAIAIDMSKTNGFFPRTQYIAVGENHPEQPQNTALFRGISCTRAISIDYDGACVHVVLFATPDEIIVIPTAQVKIAYRDPENTRVSAAETPKESGASQKRA